MLNQTNEQTCPREEVLLLNPPIRGMRTFFEHLGLEYLAASLRNHGIKVKIIDAQMNRWTAARTVKALKGTASKLIGISISFQDFADQTLNFVDKLKKAGCQSHLSIGGIYPTFAYEEILRKFASVDSVVLGEGEETFVELASKLLNGQRWQDIKGIAYRQGKSIMKNTPRPSIKDLDSIPFPARDLLPDMLKNAGCASMLTSRGCYGRCSFCCVVPFYSQFGPAVRMRSAENVLEELQYLQKDYHVHDFSFNDANFINSKKRAIEIAEKIIKKGLKISYAIECRPDDVDRDLFQLLKISGLTRVFLGVESGSQTVLDRFQKDVLVAENLKAVKILSELDIRLALGYIMFDDRTTFNEIKESFAFLKNVQQIIPKGNLLSYAYTANKVLPFCGSKFQEYLIAGNKYQADKPGYHYKFDDPSIGLLYHTLRAVFFVSRGAHKLKNMLARRI